MGIVRGEGRVVDRGTGKVKVECGTVSDEKRVSIEVCAGREEGAQMASG